MSFSSEDMKQLENLKKSIKDELYWFKVLTWTKTKSSELYNTIQNNKNNKDLINIIDFDNNKLEFWDSYKLEVCLKNNNHLVLQW